MEKIISIDAKTARRWLDGNEALLIDVRETEEYNEAHIQGAILLPLSGFTAEMVPQNPDKKIIFQCRSGKRSEQAAIIAHDIQRDVSFYNFEGGILSWIEAGYPVID